MFALGCTSPKRRGVIKALQDLSLIEAKKDNTGYIL